jgi:hypothetical protein
MRCEIFVHENTQCRKKARYIAVSWEGLMVRYVCVDHLPKGVGFHLIAPNKASRGLVDGLVKKPAKVTKSKVSRPAKSR